MRIIGLASSVVFGLLAGCEQLVPEANLRSDAAHVCSAGESLVLSKRGSGSQYRLGQAVIDSARLETTLAFVLGPRPSKAVLVDVGKRRSRAPVWIVAAIRQAGGDAFEVDSACLLPRFKLTTLSQLTGAISTDRDHPPNER